MRSDKQHDKMQDKTRRGYAHRLFQTTITFCNAPQFFAAYKLHWKFLLNNDDDDMVKHGTKQILTMKSNIAVGSQHHLHNYFPTKKYLQQQ